MAGRSPWRTESALIMSVRANPAVFEDDLDGSDADMTVNFALDSVSYDTDLNSSNAEELRAILSGTLLQKGKMR